MKRINSLIILLLATTLNAQVFTDFPEVSAPVSGSGASSIATVQDVWASFVNPAGLSRVESIQVVTSFFRPYGMSFFSNQTAGLAVPFGGKFGTVALTYSGTSTEYSGEKLSSENAFRLSHAFFVQRDINSSLAFGYSLNLYYLDYGKSAGSSGDGSDGVNLGSGVGFGVDVGIQASLHERTWLALMAKNVNSPEMGSSLSSSNLPRSISVGFGYEPYEGMTTGFVIEQPFGNHPTQYRGGIDYHIADWLILRTGVNTAPNRIALGFGIRKFGIGVDYAFVSHPILPETHQFSLCYDFKK